MDSICKKSTGWDRIRQKMHGQTGNAPRSRFLKKFTKCIRGIMRNGRNQTGVQKRDRLHRRQPLFYEW